MDSNKKVSRVAGILNLVIAVCAPFSIIFVPSKLIVAGNASLTASNIIASEMLFRAASVISIIVHIIQILFVFLLYKLLKKINKTNALLMIIFSLIGVSIALFNELNQFAVLLLLNGSDYLKVFNINQLQSLAMFFLNLHSQGLLISQIFWGIWLFPLGYLILKSGEIPKFIGILLIIAGFGYLIDCFCKLIFTNYNITISTFTFIGELLFTFWLLIKGVKDNVNDS